MNSLENNEKLDMLLFQYLEGELNAEQVQALEQQLAVDAALREELLAWRESFVDTSNYASYSASYYDTQALEEKLLLQPANKWYIRSSTWMLVILFVASWLRLAPELNDSVPDVPDSQLYVPAKPVGVSSSSLTTTTTITTTKIITGKLSSTKTIKTKPIPQAAYQPVGKSGKTNETRIVSSEIVSFEKQKPAPDIAGLQTLQAQPILRIDSVEIPRMPGLIKIEYRKIPTQPRTISRQQKRQTLRMKEKARQQRQANEFMKGNIPYVIPLNSTNF